MVIILFLLEHFELVVKMAHISWFQGEPYNLWFIRRVAFLVSLPLFYSKPEYAVDLSQPSNRKCCSEADSTEKPN